MPRPSVTLNCVADHSSDKRCERVVEVFDRESQKGCLIQLYRTPDGRLRVSVYRKDEGVFVDTSEDAVTA